MQSNTIKLLSCLTSMGRVTCTDRVKKLSSRWSLGFTLNFHVNTVEVEVFGED